MVRKGISGFMVLVAVIVILVIVFILIVFPVATSMMGGGSDYLSQVVLSLFEYINSLSSSIFGGLLGGIA